MYFFHKGVQYDVAEVLSRESCEIYLSLNGASGKWEARVCWNWENMGEKDYEGNSIEAALSKAASDRVEEGDRNT